jgi:hypothetical protein
MSSMLLSFWSGEKSLPQIGGPNTQPYVAGRFLDQAPSPLLLTAEPDDAPVNRDAEELEDLPSSSHVIANQILHSESRDNCPESEQRIVNRCQRERSRPRERARSLPTPSAPQNDVPTVPNDVNEASTWKELCDRLQAPLLFRRRGLVSPVASFRAEVAVEAAYELWVSGSKVIDEELLMLRIKFLSSARTFSDWCTQPKRRASSLT